MECQKDGDVNKQPQHRMGQWLNMLVINALNAYADIAFKPDPELAAEAVEAMQACVGDIRKCIARSSTMTKRNLL